MKIIGKVMRRILFSNAKYLERHGIEVVADHFYHPVPSPSDLRPDTFSRISECVGIDWNVEEQEAHLKDVFHRYGKEVPMDYNLKMLSPIDAVIYYTMVRHYKPKKIVEVGAGESTKYASLACIKNGGNPGTELICIDPFPSAELKEYKGITKVIEKKIQDVDAAVFEDCDMLVIDSSHVVKTGSDVIKEILEIIPRLKVGAVIHWHDIFFPMEYREEWIKSRIFFNEQYILQAFLMFNTRYKIIWASQYMHIRNKSRIYDAFAYNEAHIYPVSSLWVRRVG